MIEFNFMAPYWFECTVCVITEVEVLGDLSSSVASIVNNGRPWSGMWWLISRWCLSHCLSLIPSPQWYHVDSSHFRMVQSSVPSVRWVRCCHSCHTPCEQHREWRHHFQRTEIYYKPRKLTIFESINWLRASVISSHPQATHIYWCFTRANTHRAITFSLPISLRDYPIQKTHLFQS